MTERVIHKAPLEEPRNKKQENSPAGSQVDLGFSARNLRKNGYVKSKEDACSLLNKFDEAITLSVSHKPHIVAITESWLHDKISGPEVVLRDYSLFRKNRKGRRGGALLFIRSSLRPKQKATQT